MKSPVPTRAPLASRGAAPAVNTRRSPRLDHGPRARGPVAGQKPPITALVLYKCEKILVEVIHMGNEQAVWRALIHSELTAWY